MTRAWVTGWVVGLCAVAMGAASAAEHGGQEHGGTAAAPAAEAQASATQEHGGHEHGGQATRVEPTAEQIRQAIRDHIASIEQQQGAFTVADPITGATRTLTLDRVHERVGKTGALYYSCTDMRDSQSGESLDLDFDVDVSSGRPAVMEARIHKVEGRARYTYNDQDERVPVQE